MNKLLEAFTRTKRLTPRDIQETQLHRCLSTFDLTALGVGSTLGAGVYVVTGQVAKLQAGPAIVLSFTIAAIASILSGLCYAEFGARVPKAGSAYIYSYVTIGELCAFVIGWNLLLEYVVGTSSVARAWSAFFDSLLGDHIHNFIVSNLGSINVPGLSKYPDFLAFLFVAVITVILTTGVKQSSTVNWIFMSLNIFVITFVTVAGLYLARIENWDNFAPYGFHGVMAGAATCFYSFIGFDVVATSGEEAKTPSKSIPRAIISSLSICLLAYLGVSIALTLMLPYNVLAENTALATTFEQRGFKPGKYFVSIGAICGLSSSALGCLFPMPRILYSMGSDGVIFGFFSRVSERTGIPFIASISCGFLTALLALLFDLVSLVEMMSIGTLLAYTIVALCVLLLRYKPGSLWIVSSNIDDTSGNLTDSLDIGNEDTRESGQDGPDLTVKSRAESFGQQTATYPDGTCDIVNPESEGLVNDVKKRSTTRRPEWMSTFSQRLIAGHLDQPTSESYSIVRIAVALFVVLSVALESCLIWWLDALLSRNPFAVIPFVLILVSLLVVTELIGRQPQSKNELPFKVPLVPVTPLLAIFINTYLILMLSYVTWIRFAVWMVIGMSVYLFYGVKHSKENSELSSTGKKPGYMQLSNSAEESDKGS